MSAMSICSSPFLRVFRSHHCVGDSWRCVQVGDVGCVVDVIGVCWDRAFFGLLRDFRRASPVASSLYIGGFCSVFALVGFSWSASPFAPTLCGGLMVDLAGVVF